jgi:hypothetical protein
MVGRSSRAVKSSGDAGALSGQGWPSAQHATSPAPPLPLHLVEGAGASMTRSSSPTAAMPPEPAWESIPSSPRPRPNRSTSGRSSTFQWHGWRQWAARIRAGAGPILRRGLPDHLAEGSAECPQAGEADIEADVRHAAVGPAEQVHGPLDTAPLQITMRGLAEGRPEGADEVRLRHDRDGRQSGHVHHLRIGAIHGVTGAQQPPVGLLGGAGHGSRRSAGAPRSGARLRSVCAGPGRRRPATPAPPPW